MSFKESLRNVGKAAYWGNLAVGLAATVYNVTGRQVLHEEQAKGLALSPASQFLSENFVGNIGDAFAYILAAPLLVEALNLAVQNSHSANEGTKQFSNFVAKASPFIMAALFLTSAVDAETAQVIRQVTGLPMGTPDVLDLTGAVYGTAIALPTAVNLWGKVFPKNNKVSH